MVRVEKNGTVTTIVPARPAVKNAVDRATADALSEAFRAFDADPGARVAVPYGEAARSAREPTWLASAGPEHANRVSPDGDGPLGPTRMLLTKPIIAAVEGHAVAGGLELACLCDLRVADETAIFGVFCRRFGVPSSMAARSVCRGSSVCHARSI